jgi:hypothetical protein
MCTMELSQYTNVHNSIEDLILMCTMGLMEDTNVHICLKNLILMCKLENITNVYNGSLLYTMAILIAKLLKLSMWPGKLI